MDRSFAFNNAGVRLLEAGHESLALDLFRAALESKLVSEPASRPEEADALVPTQLPVSSECISRAESHLANMDSYIGRPVSDFDPCNEESRTPGPSRPRPQFTNGAAAEESEDNIMPPLDGLGYDPFIYCKPFNLPAGSEASTQLTSSIIVFNLGLVYQHGDRSSHKAAAFYEISAALLSSEPDTSESSMLRVAIMNNFGAWCYDNGDGEATRTCIEHLSTLFERSLHCIAPDVQQGIRSNIRWLLTPPNGGSPAA